MSVQQDNKAKVAIIDYGSGNLASVSRALSAVGFSPLNVTRPAQIDDDHILLLPGVSSFPLAMERLRADDLNSAIISRVASGQPLLGICAGMQLLFDQSTEFGICRGLSLINGSVTALRSEVSDSVKIPNIGWRQLFIRNDQINQLSKKISLSNREFVYFAHSYFANPILNEAIVATSLCDGFSVPSIVSDKNIVGMQFHPEKSGPAGLDLLEKTLNYLQQHF